MTGQGTIAIGNHTKTVLVVDDEVIMRALIEEILEENDFTVLQAEDVDHAIEMLGQNHVDVVLTDFTLPKKNGFHLAEFVKSQGNGLPVVLMTGNSAQDLQGEATAAGIHSIVQKPFQECNLVDALNQALASLAKSA